ncbi:hypothetical protein BaRGS_00014844 [Batillaria attramentaria]|uniref:Uncharacterized protein n=1 Tax=Batillaria attramentaria TaxID=370345 RepID=A0ABD0L4K3_9CAEN
MIEFTAMTELTAMNVPAQQYPSNWWSSIRTRERHAARAVKVRLNVPGLLVTSIQQQDDRQSSCRYYHPHHIERRDDWLLSTPVAFPCPSFQHVQGRMFSSGSATHRCMANGQKGSGCILLFPSYN